MAFNPDVGFHHSLSTESDSVRPVSPEGPLMGIRANMLWQDAWIMAIALAWSDDALREELKSDPAAFFKQHCNFNVPESLTIEVLDSPDADSQGVAPGWDPETGIWYLRNTVVQMYLPPPPPVEQQAIAMSAYVATGRTYPFTVC